MGLRAAEDTGSRFVAFVDGLCERDRSCAISARDRHGFASSYDLAISQRELDQAASDQQTAKVICEWPCLQEAPAVAPLLGHSPTILALLSKVIRARSRRLP